MNASRGVLVQETVALVRGRNEAVLGAASESVPVAGHEVVEMVSPGRRYEVRHHGESPGNAKVARNAQDRARSRQYVAPNLVEPDDRIDTSETGNPR